MGRARGLDGRRPRPGGCGLGLGQCTLTARAVARPKSIGGNNWPLLVSRKFNIGKRREVCGLLMKTSLRKNTGETTEADLQFRRAISSDLYDRG
jgi:hypothetical protein